MYKKQDDTCECVHAPYDSTTKRKAFFEYLIRKEKYYCRKDGFAICAKCKQPIRIPKLFFNPLLLLIYGIIVFLITIGALWFWREHILLYLLLYLLALVVFDRVFVATIFTFGKWREGASRRWDPFRADLRLIVGYICIQCTMLFVKILMAQGRFVLP